MFKDRETLETLLRIEKKMDNIISLLRSNKLKNISKER